ncbi:unnamed protein product, partial [Larinioides sclopetarius]
APGAGVGSPAAEGVGGGRAARLPRSRRQVARAPAPGSQAPRPPALVQSQLDAPQALPALRGGATADQRVSIL